MNRRELTEAEIDSLKKSRQRRRQLSSKGIASGKHRNILCPCKSGKKWKRCCGGIKNDLNANRKQSDTSERVLVK